MTDVNESDENLELFTEIFSVLDQVQLPHLGGMFSSAFIPNTLLRTKRFRWLVGVPVNGTASKWDDLTASSIGVKAKTMQILKCEMTIALPEVLGFSLTSENIPRYSYILFPHISGVPLYHLWAGHRLERHNSEVNRTCRIRALYGIASALIQLGLFSFQNSGSPVYGSGRSLLATEPARRVDYNTKAWYIFMPDLYSEENETQKAAVPRSVGNERYLGWLTRDWDPATYGYEEPMEQGVEPEGLWEDSPQTLGEYVQVYINVISRGRRHEGSVDCCRMSLTTKIWQSLLLILAVEVRLCANKCEKNGIARGIMTRWNLQGLLECLRRII
ncbi:hypothetical protein F5Y19DRAFT_474406 [Xylariaceae sp. FL1651]|nr:hypothetical protein F5Y19DRAFT_474406 [Xylariaceae sp. FL1651]